MTGSHPDTRDAATRPISVAELLARNGNIGSPPVTGRRRRHRGNSNAVTVAELTGEIPVIRDDDQEPDRDSPAPHAHRASGGGPVAEPAAEQPNGDRSATAPHAVDQAETADRLKAGSRWPKSLPHTQRGTGPVHSHYPRPVRRSDAAEAENGQPARRSEPESGAEQMSPDTVDDYAGTEVDVMDTEVRVADLSAEDSAYVRSYLHNPAETPLSSIDEPSLAGPALGEAHLGDTGADLADSDVNRVSVLDDDHTEIEADLVGELGEESSRRSELFGGALIVLQSILAVAFGAGLFIAFDQLWRWNNIVALVLTVLVTLGLVAAVQAVRKTVDIGSTLIAVAVGLLITLGPLALHAN
ncbi:MAG TPA: hypothetical protein VFQ37_15685 [Mycobacterium sp.]|nr:hypothetical protein [Mycobacterium sp.]